jgi:hypothetical protein
MSCALFISPNSSQWAPSGGEVCLQVSRQEKDRQTDRQTDRQADRQADMHLVARTRESKRDANAEGASASSFLRTAGLILQAQTRIRHVPDWDSAVTPGHAREGHAPPRHGCYQQAWLLRLSQSFYGRPKSNHWRAVHGSFASKQTSEPGSAGLIEYFYG